MCGIMISDYKENKQIPSFKSYAKSKFNKIKIFSFTLRWELHLDVRKEKVRLHGGYYDFEK